MFYKLVNKKLSIFYHMNQFNSRKFKSKLFFVLKNKHILSFFLSFLKRFSLLHKNGFYFNKSSKWKMQIIKRKLIIDIYNFDSFHQKQENGIKLSFFLLITLLIFFFLRKHTLNSNAFGSQIIKKTKRLRKKFDNSCCHQNQ